MTFHKIIQPTIGPMYRVPTNLPQLYELAVGADLSCPIPIKLRMDEIMRFCISFNDMVASEQRFVLALLPIHDARASGSDVRSDFVTMHKMQNRHFSSHFSLT